MANTIWTRRAGLAGMLGGAVVAVGMLAIMLNSGTDWSWAAFAGLVGIIAALPFVGLELFALRGQHATRAGALGQAGFLVTLLGLVATFLGIAGLIVGALISREIEGAWYTMVIGLITLLGGSALFAAALLRAGAAPRLGTLAVLVGGAAGTLIFLSSMLAEGRLSDDVEALVGFVGLFMVILCFAGWAVLGYGLWSGAQESERTAVAQSSRI